MEKNIRIRVSDTVHLAAVLHLPEQGTDRGVVICHGLLSDKDSQKHFQLATKLCEAGIAALRFDFQGRGQSPGDMMNISFSGQVKQAGAAIDALKNLACVKKIGISGSSMGGAVSILLAAKNPSVSCLVTMAAVARTDLLGERIVGPKAMEVWKRKGYLRFENEPVGFSLVQDGKKVDVPGAARRIGCRWLIIHGQKDEVVPLEDAMLLRESATCDPVLQVVAGADHSFSGDEHRQKVVNMAVDFFSGNLPASVTE